MTFYLETQNESGSKQIELWIQVLNKVEKLKSSPIKDIQKINREIKYIITKINVFRTLSIQ